MRYRKWVDGKASEESLPEELAAKLEGLAFGHHLYFDLSMKPELIPLDQLVLSRARHDGVENARTLMGEAAEGLREKRAPVSVKKVGGIYLVVDGNSTVMNALASGWVTIPCIIVEDRVPALTLAEARAVVAKYLDDEMEGRYKALLRKIKAVLTNIKEAPLETRIAEIYTRSKKQGDGNELKERNKIVLKYFEERSSRDDYTMNEMVDIVGATVVVYYPDQIATLIASFEAEAGEDLFLEEYEEKDGSKSKTRVHRDKGYHATHIKIRSTDLKLSEIRAEIQIKTMLHDAWSSKMHDLTYKPAGELDPRLKTLMESFGDSLQAIEVQSQTLRDAITTRVAAMRVLRREARLNLVVRLKGPLGDNHPAQAQYDAVIHDMEKLHQHLSNCPSDDEVLRRLASEINKLSEKGVDTFTRLKLTVYLASLRDDTVLAPIVDRALGDWAKSENDELRRALVVAAALHQTNRISEAVETIKDMLASRQIDENETTAQLAVNLANYLIEANLDKPKIDVAAKEQVRKLIAGLEAMGERALSEASALPNTKGAFLLVFGEVGNLDEGLSLCSKAFDVATTDYGRKYSELYQTYGWRRKIQL